MFEALIATLALLGSGFCGLLITGLLINLMAGEPSHITGESVYTKEF
ncbi:hypothetical protein ACFSJ3_18070 [Corallincola platygyrae]|uniref:NADH dehydrogenase subunit 3 n=1 Tax=Corallincola platygyrae TaxID=1193278 RepID=A0ABW4XTV1_9GAMM